MPAFRPLFTQLNASVFDGVMILHVYNKKEEHSTTKHALQQFDTAGPQAPSRLRCRRGCWDLCVDEFGRGKVVLSGKGVTWVGDIKRGEKEAVRCSIPAQRVISL